MHSHFFEGVNLTGGIPLFGWPDCLGVDGISTGLLLVIEGWVTSVELRGMCPAAGGVALLVKAGGTRLSTGKADISGAWRVELKGWWEGAGICPLLFHSLHSASNLKWEGWDQGVIINLVLFSMDLSGNFTQYDSGFLAGWLIIPVSIYFLALLSCKQAVLIWIPLVNGLKYLADVSSVLTLDVSTDFPTLDGIWGSEVLSLLPVTATRGDGKLPAMGVTLYWSCP